MRDRMLILCACLGLSGCFDSGGGAVGPDTPTLIAVSPEDFLGQVPCGSGQGALQRYSVTFYDIGYPERPTPPFELPSTPPVRCQQGVGTAFVYPGRRYVAQIDAYDRNDLVPLAAGSRLLADPAGSYVAPRWTTRCGDPQSGQGAGVAIEFFTVHLGSCNPLSDISQSQTGISVSLDAALGNLSCGVGSGLVERFEVRLDGAGSAPLGADCGQAVQFDGLTPGQNYGFSVQAFEAGSSAPRWGTHCQRSAVNGAVVGANCDALSERGALHIDVPALLSSAGLKCSELTRVVASLNTESGTQTLSQLPPACEAGLTFTNLVPGVYSASVLLEAASGNRSARCGGDVPAGNTSAATCTLL